jgi:small nuclear ribonucleoprotein (snRNP)-like protein
MSSGGGGGGGGGGGSGGGQKPNIIAELVGKVVCIVTLEGRCLVGTLRGVDLVNNLVLENSHERTFHADRGMEMEPMGLYLVRGDSLCVGFEGLARGG